MFLRFPGRVRFGAAGVLALLMTALANAAEPAAPLVDASARGDLTAVRALIGKKIDVNAPRIDGMTALHAAVHADRLDIADALLRAGAKATAADRYGVTPLYLAAVNGNADVIRRLLDAGVDPNAVDPGGETALMTAARTGSAAALRTLLERGATVDAKEPEFGQTALMIAVRENNDAAVQILLEAGASPDAQTRKGPTPAFVPPCKGTGCGSEGVGINRGGVPDRGRRAEVKGGMTPLLYAARHNHVEAAKRLIDAGADVNVKEANGIWPLLMAISNNNMAAAHYLLARGGNVNGQDWYGRSPLWEAVNVRNLYVHNATFKNGIDRGPVLELIRALLAAGADVNARTKETPPFRHHLLEITGSLEWVDFTGQTPFLTAALAGDVTVMKLLLEHGANPRIDTYQGTSPLMAAAGVNWVLAQTWTEGPDQLLDAVKLCVDLGMEVNQANSMGITALHGAANRGSDDIIRFLVARGADLTAQDNEHRSPLDWAKGVFLATHPAQPKPSTIALITELLKKQGKEIR
jgi:uncharacterized protein